MAAHTRASASGRPSGSSTWPRPRRSGWPPPAGRRCIAGRRSPARPAARGAAATTRSGCCPRRGPRRRRCRAETGRPGSGPVRRRASRGRGTGGARVPAERICTWGTGAPALVDDLTLHGCARREAAARSTAAGRARRAGRAAARSRFRTRPRCRSDREASRRSGSVPRHRSVAGRRASARFPPGRPPRPGRRRRVGPGCRGRCPGRPVTARATRSKVVLARRSRRWNRERVPGMAHAQKVAAAPRPGDPVPPLPVAGCRGGGGRDRLGPGRPPRPRQHRTPASARPASPRTAPPA